LVPALLLACFAAIVLSWNPFGAQPDQAFFEALLQPSVAGEAQFMATVDGIALRKETMLSQPVEPGKVNHVRFAIRAGKLGEFRFTPLTSDGQVDLLRCWISSESGEVIALLPPASIAANLPGGASRINKDGSVRFPSRLKNAVPTSIQYNPPTPIDLAATTPPPFWEVALLFVLVFVGSFNLQRVVRWTNWTKVDKVLGWVRIHPRRAILIAAIFSVIISCFPVVFFGKSFISPDNGAQLLYEKFPTVPGAQGGRIENPAGSDMGATLYWHMPASMIQHRAIFEDGEFPLWNRYTWCGVPLWAQCMSMLGDPLHWPAVLTGGAAWAWDLKFLLAKVLFAFGVGLLVRVSSRNLTAALLITLSAPYIGFFAFRFCHPGFFALCYAPWILLPWLEAVQASTRRQVAGWAALLLFANWWQFNSGTAKESMAFLLCLNATGALAILGARLPVSEKAVRLGLFVWANVLFVLLAAPLWMTFIDALGKAQTAYDEPRVYQIQPGLVIGLFDDIFYRQLVNMEFISNPSVNFFILLGTAWALVRARALAADRTFLAVLVGAIVVAAVTFGVISPDILAQVPLMRNIYHFDDTFSGVLFILLFVIAGYGLRECRRRMRLPEWTGDWLFVMGFVGVLLAAFFGLTQASHRVGITFLKVGTTVPKSEFMWEYGAALVVALAILPWAWRAFRLRWVGAMSWLLVAVAAFATLHFRHGMYLVTNFDIYTMNPKKRLDLRDIRSPAIRTIEQDMHEPARVVGIDWVMTAVNIPSRLEAIYGADALQNPAVRELETALGLREVWGWRLLVLRQDVARVHRGLDLLGVRYYMGTPGKTGDLPDLRSLGTSDLDVYESDTAWPRAFFTDAVLGYQNVTQIARLVQDGDGRPFAAMLPAERSRLPLPTKDFKQRQIVPATHYHLTQNSTTFEVDAPGAGVAVLGEAWMPNDIEVTVDGQPGQTLRVDHAFRGVFIPNAGHHVVQFRYWPAVLDRAIWLAVAGLIGLLITVVVFLRRKPQPQATPIPDSPTPSLVGQA
jgi:hypothetical protein